MNVICYTPKEDKINHINLNVILIQSRLMLGIQRFW